MQRRRWRRRRLYLVSIRMTIARRSSSRVSQRRVSQSRVLRTFFCSRAKKDSMLALIAGAVGATHGPAKPVGFQEPLGRVGAELAPAVAVAQRALRSLGAIASRIAQRARLDFIRESME